MSRVKTFDSTGVAPNGVFYAGDANAIQDHYADLSNYAQTVDVGTLRVAEAGLQLIRYSSSPLEARITAAFRADGIVRGLSGLYAGTYTTAQRNAIAAGSRPYGLVILNTDTNALEINLGSDASPSWQTVGANSLPIGTLLPYTGNEGSVPAGFGLADGTEISRTTYASLNALYSAQSYPFGTGNGSTTFNKPDMRGRIAPGRDNMGGSAASRMPGVTTMGAVGGSSTHTLVNGEMPIHAHGGSTVASNTSNSTAFASGGRSVGHTHSGTTGTQNQNHTHNVTATLYDGTAGGVIDTHHIANAPSFGSAQSSITLGSTAESGTHTHNFSTGAESSDHTHQVGAHTHPIPSLTINNDGGGGAHNNLQPYIAVNWIVKLL